MATDSEDERTKWSPWAIAAAVLLLLIFGVIAVGTFAGASLSTRKRPPSCRGAEEEGRGREEDKKTDFEIFTPIVMPSEPKTPLPIVKPGHWESVSQEMRANYRDFVGDSRLSVIDAQNRPYPVANTPFNVRTSRPVLLTKARPKTTETTLLRAGSRNRCSLPPSSKSAASASAPAAAHAAHDDAFVPVPLRGAGQGAVAVSLLKTLDSVTVPFDGETDSDDTSDPLHYRVVPLPMARAIPLSDNPLTWTSIAYVLWDEVDPGDSRARARAGTRRLAALGRPTDHQRPRFARFA